MGHISVKFTCAVRLNTPTPTSDTALDGVHAFSRYKLSLRCKDSGGGSKNVSSLEGLNVNQGQGHNLIHCLIANTATFVRFHIMDGNTAMQQI